MVKVFDEQGKVKTCDEDGEVMNKKQIQRMASERERAHKAAILDSIQKMNQV